MDEQARQTAFMSALVTEHFVLQSVASTTISEAGSRASLYVFSLSSSLVAMGFTAETDAFPTLVAAVLPALFVLGWFTVVRLVDTSVGSYRVQEAIAHIRGFYRQLTPEAPYYFPVWQGSDEEAAEALAMLGTTPRRSTVLFTTAGMIAAVNSLVGGVGAALLTNEVLGHGSDVPAVVVGCGFGVACLAVASIYQRTGWRLGREVMFDVGIAATALAGAVALLAHGRLKRFLLRMRLGRLLRWRRDCARRG